MTTDQIILFSLFGLVFGLLLWGKFRYDIVAFTALIAGVIMGVIPTKDAFSGFGHPATIIVALVLIAISNIPLDFAYDMNCEILGCNNGSPRQFNLIDGIFKSLT